MANVVYRGPNNAAPQVVNLPVVGAYLPATFVTSDGVELTQAISAIEQQVYLLANRRFTGQDIDTAYAVDEVGVAYAPKVGEMYQARMAAATYTDGDALTVAASGRLAAATTGTVVVAYFKGAAGAVSAGALADVTIANSHVAA